MNSEKYKIESGRLVNIKTGVAIPEDEPVFVLRAKDRFSENTLEFYQELAEEEPFASEVDNCLSKFINWQNNNKGKIKEPD